MIDKVNRRKTSQIFDRLSVSTHCDRKPSYGRPLHSASASPKLCSSAHLLAANRGAWSTWDAGAEGVRVDLENPPYCSSLFFLPVAASNLKQADRESQLCRQCGGQTVSKGVKNCFFPRSRRARTEFPLLALERLSKALCRRSLILIKIVA